MATKIDNTHFRELVFLDMWECDYVYPDGKFCRELIDKGDYCSLHYSSDQKGQAANRSNTPHSTTNIMPAIFRYDDYINSYRNVAMYKCGKNDTKIPHYTEKVY